MFVVMLLSTCMIVPFIYDWRDASDLHCPDNLLIFNVMVIYGPYLQTKNPTQPMYQIFASEFNLSLFRPVGPFEFFCGTYSFPLYV